MWQALIGPVLDALSKQTGQQEQQNAAMHQQLVGMNGQQATPLQHFSAQNQGGMSEGTMNTLANMFKKKPVVDQGSIQVGTTQAQGPMSAVGASPENSSQMYDPSAWTNYMKEN